MGAAACQPEKAMPQCCAQSLVLASVPSACSTACAGSTLEASSVESVSRLRACRTALERLAPGGRAGSKICTRGGYSRAGDEDGGAFGPASAGGALCRNISTRLGASEVQAFRHLSAAERREIEVAMEEWCEAFSSTDGRRLVLDGSEQCVHLETRPLMLVAEQSGNFPLRQVQQICVSQAACCSAGVDCMLAFAPSPAEGSGDDTGPLSSEASSSGLRVSFGRLEDCMGFALCVRVLQLIAPDLQDILDRVPRAISAPFRSSARHSTMGLSVSQRGAEEEGMIITRSELIQWVDETEPASATDSPSARKVRPLLPECLRLETSGNNSPREPALGPGAAYRKPNDSPSAKGVKRSGTVEQSFEDGPLPVIHEASGPVGSPFSAPGSGDRAAGVATETEARCSPQGSPGGVAAREVVSWQRFHEARRERLAALLAGRPLGVAPAFVAGA